MSDKPIASSLLRQEGPQQELDEDDWESIFDAIGMLHIIAPYRKELVEKLTRFRSDRAAAQARIEVLEGSIDYLRNVIDHPVRQEQK